MSALWRWLNDRGPASAPSSVSTSSVHVPDPQQASTSTPTTTYVPTHTKLQIPTDPWERVRQAFMKNEYGFRGVEAHITLQALLATGLAGMAVGGISGSRESDERFRQTHGATKFLTVSDAKRRYVDFLMVRFGINGFKTGAKLAFIITAPVAAVAAYSAYCNRPQLWLLWPASVLSVGLTTLRHGPYVMLVHGSLWATVVTLVAYGGLYPAMKSYGIKDAAEAYDILRRDYHKTQLKGLQHNREITEIKQEHDLWFRWQAEAIHARMQRELDEQE